MDVPALLAAERMKARRARIDLERTRRPERFRLEERGTSQVITRDAAGNVASITTSLRDMFGARLVTPSGIVLNDALADFSSERLERRFRARRYPNTPRGGARPVTAMTPTLVLHEGAVSLALGGAGGLDAPAAVTQALLARLVFARGPSECVADSRVRVPAEGGLTFAPGTDLLLLADLRRRGEDARADRPDFSAVSLLAIHGTGAALRLDGAVDPRKGGAALTR
ncbi:MAG: hypothetical protein EXR75_14285 [Myxococcales bacterium]|nr:hypothetical protein [Myxococcales bacterium]